MVVLAAAALVACHWGGDGSSDSSGGTSNPPPPPPPFTASLDATSLTIPQGSGAGVHVSLNRATSFSDDVTIALESTPDGLIAYTYTVPGVASEALIDLRVTSELASGSVNSLALVASGGGTTVRLPFTLTVSSPVPTSDSLIAAALTAGDIDYPTSLLYRAYAMFGDSRLPAQYAGGANPHNDSFFREASNPDLPDNVKAELAPFLARPTDPASIFQQSAAAAQKLSGRARANATASDAATPCTLAEGEVEKSGWKSVLLSADNAVPVRFWIQCSTVAGADDVFLKKAGLEAAQVLPGLTSLMGQPIADYGGDFFGTDEAIDVYLVDPCGTVPVPRVEASTLCAEDKESKIDGATINTTSASSNTDPKLCSDFVLFDLNELAGGPFRSTFAHEFFHVLQDAYNCQVAFQESGSEYWFTEASATWAEAHFVKQTASAEVHKRFTDDFQTSTRSLHESSEAASDHEYAAYIWPYFFEQKSGAQTMQSAWAALRPASQGAFDQANQLLDNVYDFKSNFRLFAIENLNIDLPDVLTAQNRYAALAKPYSFPGTKPKDLTEIELTDPPQDVPSAVFDLGALQAEHFRYYLTSSKIKQVIFRFGRYSTNGGLDIDGIVKIAGQPWQKRSYNDDREVRFCLDKPDQDLVDIYLVLSNHSVPMDQHEQGDVKIETSDVACKAEWVGTATSEFGYKMNASVTWELDETESTDTKAVFHPTGNVTFTAPGCTVTPNNADIKPEEGALVIDYSTDPATYEAQAATVWPGTYQCGDGGSLEAGAGGIWIGDATNPALGASGTVSAANSNGKKTIGGHNSGNGYTFTWQFTEL
jgi:hypothetical protein